MKVINFLFILMSLTFFTTSNFSYAQWKQVADIPTARTAHAVASVNGKIYAVGGEQTKSVVLEEYNPQNDSWTKKTDMLTARGWLSLNSTNNKIYAIGGYNVSFSHSTVPNVEEYDPVTDSWTTKSPMPEPRWGHATGVVNGKIYIIGGARNWPIDKMYDQFKHTKKVIKDEGYQIIDDENI